MCQTDVWGSVCESCACRERLQHVAKVVIQQQNVMFTASTKHQVKSTLLLLYDKPLGRLAYAPAVRISRCHDLADPRSTAGYSFFAQQPLGPLDCLLCVAVSAHACLWRWIPGSGSMEGAGAGGVARTPSFGWQQPNWHSRCATTGAHVCLQDQRLSGDVHAIGRKCARCKFGQDCTSMPQHTCILLCE